MTDEFEYQDFAIVAEEQARVVAALVRLSTQSQRFDAQPVFAMGLDRLSKEEAEAIAPGAPRSTSGALLSLAKSAIFGASPEEPTEEEAPPVFLHTDAAAQPGAPITWGAGIDYDVTRRVSTIAARPSWTLLEFADIVRGMSPTSAELSDALEGAEVYFFRRSGANAQAVQFDFHLYRGFAPVRRVMRHQNISDDGVKWWESSAEGPLTDYESERLYTGATDQTLLTDGTQRRILAKMGIDVATLFTAEGTRDPVLFNDDPSGAPAAEIAALWPR